MPLPIGALPTQPATLIAKSTEHAIARNLFIAGSPQGLCDPIRCKLRSCVNGSSLVHKSHTGRRFAPRCVVLRMKARTPTTGHSAAPMKKRLARNGSDYKKGSAPTVSSLVPARAERIIMACRAP